MNIKRKSGLLFGILILAMTLGIFSLVIGPVNADSPIFVVSPSGGDDTANIQAAFDDAIAAGPGSIVQLTSGQFYTNEILVENFYGTFKGAGDLTKIDVLRGLDTTLPGVFGPWGTHIFIFSGGDVCIKDLSFEITPYYPAEPWGAPPGWEDLLSPILITGDINSRIKNVDFSGHEGTALYNPDHPLYLVKSYNVRAGVVYGGGLPTTGRHILTKCNFDSLWLGISAFGLMNCEMTINSNSISGGAIGIINAECDNSKIEISKNHIETTFFGGIWVMQPPPRELSQWLIIHNTIKVLSLESDGIALMDFSHTKSLEVVVSHNKIILDGANWGGMWTYGLQDAFISNNIILGEGYYGIGSVAAYNHLMLGNNVQNVDPNWGHIVLLWASECVVVGGSTKTNVLDIGGLNNLIVGMNNMHDTSLGQEIQEAMEQKKELVQSFP